MPPPDRLFFMLLILCAGLLTPFRLLVAQDWDGLKAEIRAAYPDVPRVSVDTLAAWIDGGVSGLVLLDSRTPEEAAVSRIRGARRVDPDRLDPAALADVPRDARVVVYCSVGYRSAGIARQLREAGWTDVYNLEGSIFEWANRGYPVYRDGEAVEAVHPYDRRWGRWLDAALHAYRP